MAGLHPHRRQLSQQQDPAAIFSPSVARIAASAARDWSYVDSWLASKFPSGRCVPSFERNPDTLKALLALAAANESADDERLLLSRTDAAYLKAIGGRHSQREPPGLLRGDLLAAVEHALPTEGRNALNSLANLAVDAGAAFPEPQELGRHIAKMQGCVFETEQTIARVESLERQIRREAHEAAELLQELQSHRYRPPNDLAKQNLDLLRKIKLLSPQLSELQDRAAASGASADATHPSIDHLSSEEHHLLALLARNKELHGQLAAFSGLPGDPHIAREELDALRRQLHASRARRDTVFEGLVERESPVKRR